MQHVIMTFRRGKTIVKNDIQKHASMTIDQLQRNYSARFATPEEIQKDKLELSGPEWRALKADRYYIAFKESN